MGGILIDIVVACDPANIAPDVAEVNAAEVLSNTLAPSTVTTTLNVLEVVSVFLIAKIGIIPPDPVISSMVFSVLAVNAPDNVDITAENEGTLDKPTTVNPATFCAVTILVVRLDAEELGNMLERNIVILKTPLVSAVGAQ